MFVFVVCRIKYPISHTFSQDENMNTNDVTGTRDNSDDQNKTTSDADDPIIAILSQVTTEYQQLSQQQGRIEDWIQQLQVEENAIQRALEQATIVPVQKPKHQQALERLERALFQEESSDDDDDDTSDSDEDHDDKNKIL